MRCVCLPLGDGLEAARERQVLGDDPADGPLHSRKEQL
jgi:hypothetical protein